MKIVTPLAALAVFGFLFYWTGNHILNGCTGLDFNTIVTYCPMK